MQTDNLTFTHKDFFLSVSVFMEVITETTNTIVKRLIIFVHFFKYILTNLENTKLGKLNLQSVWK